MIPYDPVNHNPVNVPDYGGYDATDQKEKRLEKKRLEAEGICFCIYFMSRNEQYIVTRCHFSFSLLFFSDTKEKEKSITIALHF